MKKLLLIILVILSLNVSSVYAGCEYCSDSRLGCTGDTEKEILEKCGPPQKTVYYENIFHEVVRKDYYYDLGKGKRIRIFIFEKGVLVGFGTIQ